MVTVDDIRKVALALPRTTEHLIRDRVKFRVGQIVYVALSRDEKTMGFGFPREERAALVAAEPDKFFLPDAYNMRFQWVETWLDRLDVLEMRELVVDAWRMCVPKSVAAQYQGWSAPSLVDLRWVAATFQSLGNVDRSWLRFLESTAPAPDLSRPEHRDAALTWLNSWACRIPRGPAFGDGLAKWWPTAHLPTASGLLGATDADIALTATAFEHLAALELGRRRLGPTAAAKLLYGLRPNSIVPWDAAIAAQLHGARDATAFAAHQHLGRRWARALVGGTGLSETELPVHIGRSNVSLAKLLDEYLYLLASGHTRPLAPTSRRRAPS
jgi:hypothetical protein